VVRTCDKHAGVAKLYGEAQQAIAAGDMAAAKTKLEQVIASDPAYRKAKAQLDEIVAKKKPAVDKEDTSAPPPISRPPSLTETPRPRQPHSWCGHPTKSMASLRSSR